MKHQLPGFLSGILVTTMVLGLGVSALAATGALTIEVNPINVQVNGQTFQPKDAQGNSVPVFAYNGTTYAPLRALAEAYGLKVGYDAATNMATVGETTPTKTPDKPAADYSTWTAEEEKAYQEFKGMWKVEERILKKTVYQYVGVLTEDELKGKLREHKFDYWYKFLMRFSVEAANGISLNFGKNALFMASDSSVVYDVVFGKGAQTDGEPDI